MLNKFVGLRKELGLSQNVVARAIGVTPNTLAKWEREDVKPSRINMQKISNLVTQWQQWYVRVSPWVMIDWQAWQKTLPLKDLAYITDVSFWPVPDASPVLQTKVVECHIVLGQHYSFVELLAMLPNVRLGFSLCGDRNRLLRFDLLDGFALAAGASLTFYVFYETS